VLDAARKMPSLRAALVVTSDKCYENREWVWGYRETDPMGGAAPYSSSKGCAELVTAAYRRSFFSDTAGPQLASVRAGNVFGGGDWNADRLVPDIVKAAVAGKPVDIRNPRSIRPWQHVLEPLSGYLNLAAKMLSGARDCSEAWNFGPDHDATVDVETLARAIQRAWGKGGPEFRFGAVPAGPHEAGILRLDNTKARTRLGWQPRLSLEKAVDLTVEWYRSHAANVPDMRALSEAQIERFAKT
jgi:CDP-glucose 4,6-dehydratase